MKSKILFLIIGVSFFLTACDQAVPSDKTQSKKGLVKISILYPNGEGKTFDMDYYSSHHMPMLKNLFGESLKTLEIDKGISGRTADDPIPYLAIGYLYFESISAYNKAFGPHASTILEDIPNYTNIQPVIQISEVIE